MASLTWPWRTLAPTMYRCCWATAPAGLGRPPTSRWAAPISAAVGDFNRDGNLDLVAANYNSNNVSVLLGNGTGSFGAATNFAVGTNPQSVAVGDFNRRRQARPAVANGNSPSVEILLGTGTGSFGEPQLRSGYKPIFRSSRGLQPRRQARPCCGEWQFSITYPYCWATEGRPLEAPLTSRWVQSPIQW